MSVLRGFLFENLGLKLVAIVLALVVYLHVYTERPATMIVSFPVELTSLSDTLAVVSQTPVSVAAELKGTGKQLIRLRLAERRVMVPLGGVGPGRYQRTITVDDLPIQPAGPLEVVRLIGPQMVEMQIERVAERTVPVAARIDGLLPDNASWSGEWRAEPAHVSMRGPATAIAHLDSVELTSVRLDASRDTIRAVVGPAVMCAGCQMVPSTVTLRIPITRAHR